MRQRPAGFGERGGATAPHGPVPVAATSNRRGGPGRHGHGARPGAAGTADWAVTPLGPAWAADAPGDSTLLSGSTLYVGGEFTGGYAALSADTGQLLWRAPCSGISP